MPWIVLLSSICDCVSPTTHSALVQIEGKTSTKAGRVRRPPITPLQHDQFELQYEQSSHLLIISEKEEIETCDNSYGEFQLVAAQAKIVASLARSEHVGGIENR